jgi:hypothetical protein
MTKMVGIKRRIDQIDINMPSETTIHKYKNQLSIKRLKPSPLNKSQSEISLVDIERFSNGVNVSQSNLRYH